MIPNHMHALFHGALEKLCVYFIKKKGTTSLKSYFTDFFFYSNTHYICLPYVFLIRKVTRVI